jgi:protein SCO1/2
VSWKATAITASTSLVLVLCAFAWATDGFAVLTAEQARQRNVARTAPPLPPLHVEPVVGPAGDWREAVQQDGRSLVLHFVYARCRTLCSVQSAQTRELQREIEARGWGQRVRLVTVSFDPVNDSLPALKQYAQRLGAKPAVWGFWRPSREAELRPALAALGIVVLPDDQGEFIHNAAWLVIDAQARVRAIVPQEWPLRALRLAAEIPA